MCADTVSMRDLGFKNAYSTQAAHGDTTQAVPSLVSTSWLASNLSKVVPIDATWYLNPQISQGTNKNDDWAIDAAKGLVKQQPVRDARKEFEERHIEGARFFDIDEISDKLNSLPHMVPSVEEFADHMGNLGVNNSDHVVVYDSHGIFSSPRVWWTFKVFGHDKVSVLDGGLPKWLQEGRPVTSRAPTTQPTKYQAVFKDDLVIDYQTLMMHVSDFMYAKNFTIVDARPRGRFAGFQPEPRPNLPAGHIPGAINIPQPELVDPDSKTLLPPDDILERFARESVDLDRPIVTMCGSGVTASTLFLALDVIGKRTGVKLYDGSWSEWASKAKSPIKKWT
ncbi:hypothetical protein HDU85_007176 [Gaertneriomyces sp. JEL0708]|nr:hypothetical protein HDU85_007176 [Gaertneriomyces sp. JEL0708]